MDLTNLSNEDLLALKNKDYSKLSNQALLSLKQTQIQPKQTMLEKMKSLASPQNISGVARPLLQGTGATLGGLAGLPLAPETLGGSSVAGGVLGFGIGDQLANRLDTRLGLRQPNQNVQQVAQEGGQSLYKGLQNEAVGQVAAPIIGLAGKAIKPFAATLSGVKPRDIDVLAENPGAILLSSLKEAGSAMQSAKTAAGIASTPEADIAKALRDDKPFVDSLVKKMGLGQKLTAQEAFEGNQAVNAMLKNENNKDAKRGLMLLKNKFQDVLSETPDLLPAMKKYSIAKSGEAFRHVLPQTQSGKGAVLRTMAMIGSVMAGGKGIPAAAMSVPAIVGGGTIVGSQIQQLLANPATRQAVLAPLLNALRSNK